jgi:nicotinate phosphoribosyltransferase
VKIFLSGGVTREDVCAYRDIVDAFGVGGSIANAPVIDFSLDIVEMNGVPKAKRGKRSGAKQVWESPDGVHIVLPEARPGPAGARPLIVRYIEDGKIVQGSGWESARLRLLQNINSVPTT